MSECRQTPFLFLKRKGGGRGLSVFQWFHKMGGKQLYVNTVVYYRGDGACCVMNR